MERERELERITALLDRARAGEGCHLVIEGPAGIGKTRLARAAGQEAEVRGFLTLAGRGSVLEREYSFGLVRQLLEPPLRAASPAFRAELLAGAAALGAPAVLPELEVELQHGDSLFSTLHGLFWLCANLAEQQPLLLLADDAQWLDESSLQFLAFLANRIEGLPILLLVTRRSQRGLDADSVDDPSAEHLALAPLSLAGVTSLLRIETDSGEVEEAFATACHEATGGNPFLLAQVIQALRERDVPFTTVSVDLFGAVGSEAVSAAVRRRLARLSPAANAVASAAALLGDGALLVLAAELAGVDESVAAAAAAELTRAGVFEDARPLRFEHPIVRGAVESALEAGERAALHRRAAELLVERGASPDEVAVHLLPSEPGAREWVVTALAEASRRAIARGAPAAAVPMLKRSLAEPPRPESRPRLLLELGKAESMLGEPAAADHLREAQQLMVDPVERARCTLALAWTSARMQSDGVSLVRLIDQAIDDAGEVDRELALELEAARVAVFTGDADRARQEGARLERFAGVDGSTTAECALLAHLAHFRLDSGEAADHTVPLAERAVANNDLIAGASLEGPWLMSTIIVLRNADHNEAALRTLGVVLSVAERFGSVTGFALGSVLRATVLLRAGDVRAAEADARAGLDAAPPGGWLTLPAIGTLIEVLIEAGQLDEAYELLVANAAEKELPDIRPATVLLLSRAALWWERGDPVRTLADLDRARARLASFGNRNVVGLDGRIRAALAHHALGESDIAREEADAALTAARRWDTPSAIGITLRACALVGDRESRLELLRQAAGLLQQSPRRLEHARAPWSSAPSCAASVIAPPPANRCDRRSTSLKRAAALRSANGRVRSSRRPACGCRARPGRAPIPDAQ